MFDAVTAVMRNLDPQAFQKPRCALRFFWRRELPRRSYGKKLGWGPESAMRTAFAPGSACPEAC